MVGFPDALTPTGTGTSAALNSEILNNAASFTIGGAGSLALQRVQSNTAVFQLTKEGPGQLILGPGDRVGLSGALPRSHEKPGLAGVGRTGRKIGRMNEWSQPHSRPVVNTTRRHLAAFLHAWTKPLLRFALNHPGIARDHFCPAGATVCQWPLAEKCM